MMIRIARMLIPILMAIALSIFPGCGGGSKDRAPDEGTVRSVGLYPASVFTVKGIQWGYIDASGKFIINPVYSTAGDFQSNGLAAVAYNNRWGIIDRTGKAVVEPRYEYINAYSEGIAVAWESGGSKALDEQGRIIFQSKETIGDFHDDRAYFARTDPSGNWLFGYIDRKGSIVIQPKYSSPGDFQDGKALVRLPGGEFAIIGKDGKEIKRFNYETVRDYSEGLLAFRQKENDKFGFINEKGKIVIAPRFLGIVEGFKNGRAVVDMSDEYYNPKRGLIDTKGKFIIKPEYSVVQQLGEGMVSIGIPIDKSNPQKGAKLGVANEKGKTLTGFQYYNISNYKNALASASDHRRTFFIDKSGKRAAALPMVEGIGTLELDGDVIKADVDRRVFYLDKSGRVIYEPNRELTVNGNIKVIRTKYRPNRNYLTYYPQISGMDNKQSEAAVNKKLMDTAVTKRVSQDEELDFSYEGDFDIEFFNKNLIVFRYTGYEYPFGAAHGMPMQEFLHLDMKTGKFYELRDLFKGNSNYVKKLSEIVRQQIVAQGESSGIWLESYTGIKENQPFYITKDALNLYFYPYEIAAYAAGFPTFTIPFRDIMDIINKEGAFWKSFN